MTIKARINFFNALEDGCSVFESDGSVNEGYSVSIVDIEFDHVIGSRLDAMCVLAIELILRERKDLTAWVVLSNSAWQPKNRISRYYKLWKNLEKTHGDIFSGSSYEREVELESEFGYKYIGAAKLFSLNKLKLSNVRVSGFLFYYILIPDSVILSKLLKDEWSIEKAYDRKLVDVIVSAGGILVAHVSWFDENPSVEIFYNSEDGRNSVFASEHFWRDIEYEI